MYRFRFERATIRARTEISSPNIFCVAKRSRCCNVKKKKHCCVIVKGETCDKIKDKAKEENTYLKWFTSGEIREVSSTPPASSEAPYQSQTHAATR